MYRAWHSLYLQFHTVRHPIYGRVPLAETVDAKHKVVRESAHYTARNVQTDILRYCGKGSNSSELLRWGNLSCLAAQLIG